MNKDVIYIEPEDDITDVVSRIKNAEQHIVALVPPKKLGILRSAVNIKLIARAGKQFDKAVVLVTADPSIMKLAGTVGIPVAKTLQSRPVIPKVEEMPVMKKSAQEVETIEDDSEDEPEKKPAKKAGKEPDMKLNSNDTEKSEKEKKADKKAGLLSKIPNFEKYRKFIIAGAVAFVALVGFLIWAIGFSGAAEIVVKIRTSSSSFAETVTLVTKAEEADPEKGKILMEKVEYEKENKVDFVPTGEKDVGNKASGSLTVQATAEDEFSTRVPSGAQFRMGELTYTATEDVTISWDGKVSTCGELSGRSCVISVTVPVIAAEGGDKYNIAAGQSPWTTNLTSIPGFSATNGTMSGGTSEKVKVVTDEDIKTATSNLEKTDDAKEALLDKVGKDVIVIDASYEAKTGDPESNPAVGEKVSTEKAELKVKTTYMIYVVDKASIEKYIKAATDTSLGADQIVYNIGSPFFERFVENDGVYTAKLKTTIKSGPEVTKEDVMEKVKGKKTGEVQSILQSINGVSNVTVNTPYFWVNSVPGDESRITINIEVEE